MNILRKLTIKNLKLNKKRTIVTIIGIILSVSMICAVSSLAESFRQSLIYMARTQGDYHYIYYNVPKEDLNIFKSNRNIEKIFYSWEVGYSILPESKNEFKPYAYVISYTKDSISMFKDTLINGRLPQNEDEILITSHLETSARIKYSIGDEITLNIGKRLLNGYELNQNNPYLKEEKEEIKDTTLKKYKVVGVIKRPSYDLESYSAPGFTFVTVDNTNNNKYTIYARYNINSLKNTDAHAHIIGVDPKIYSDLKSGRLFNLSDEKFKTVMSEIDKAKYGYNENENLIRLEALPLNDTTTKVLLVICFIIILIIMISSIFCIKNSFSISLTEKTRQYGMLSSIGATKKQLKKSIYYEAIILGTIGIVIGVLSGILATYILIIISNKLMFGLIEEKLIFSTSTIAIVITIILSYITVLLSALSSARKASKLTPLSAIRNNEDIKIKSKKIKCPKIIKKLFGIGGVVSYKNLKRNKKKYRTAVISIIVCVTTFIALSYFINRMIYATKTVYGEINYNISVEDQKLNLEKLRKMDNINKITIFKQFTFLTNDNSENLTTDFKKNIEIGDVEISNGTNIKRLYSFRIMVLSDYDYNEYIKQLGLDYEKIKDKALVYNKIKVNIVDSNKNKSHFKQMDVFKDKIDIDLSSNNIEINKKIDIKTVDKTPNNFFTLREQPHIFISNEQYNEIFSEKIEKLGMFGMNVAYIDSSNPKDLQNLIEKELSDITIVNYDELNKQLKSFYLLICIFLYGFITVIALIGITNIVNTISTSVELRQIQFATLKSIGMTNKEFNRMISLESLFYGTKAMLIAIPLGTILSYIIHTSILDLVEVKFEIPYISIIISAIVVYIILLIIMKFSINKINKKNIIETIRKENI